MLFRSKIEEKNLELAVNIPEEQLMVLADQDRIAQVVTNLLDNAVKFCEMHGTLKLWVYCADAKVHVNISNTGEIIPEQDLPFVFDRFFKVDNRTTENRRGQGLGFPSSRKFCSSMGRIFGSIRSPAWGRFSPLRLSRRRKKRKHSFISNDSYQ